MKFSSFGQKFTADSGILQLMDDLGRPLPEGVTPYRLGGGNPARVPEVEQAYRREMERLLSTSDAFEQAISQYDPPQGRVNFIEALVQFFRATYKWDIGIENIAVTNGSQSAFFFLFNLFSGKQPQRRTILFPLVPEYIGYADQGIESDTFVTLPSKIELLGDHSFKYHINFELVKEYLSAHPEVGAMCVSRPTNPTGNVLTNSEIEFLSHIAAEFDIPLLIDNAYGMPFPNIIFPDMLDGTPEPYWDDHVILSMSLSKIGLPALRNGIIVASEPIIKALSALNSIVSLASGSLGQVLTEGMIARGELTHLADSAVRPFYRSKSLEAQSYINTFFSGRNYRIHRSEGALFLWMYLPDLKITSHELYYLLKEKGVVVVPGEYFFFGIQDGLPIEKEWKNHPHRNNCLRLNYSRPTKELSDGLKILADVSASYCR